MTPSALATATAPLRPIGRVSSVLRSLADCPRQPDERAPPATLVLRSELESATAGLAEGDRIIVVTWLDRADRDVLRTRPRNDPNRAPVGIFATRSADRPNPIGLHETTLTSIVGRELGVAGLEALDGTPILDIKPVLGPVARR